MIQTVVFDLDDTLYPERMYVRSGFQAVEAWLVAQGEKPGFLDCTWALFEAGQRGNLFDTALSLLNHQTTEVTELVAVYRAHTPHLRLFDDAQQVLKHCAARGLGTALLTDGYLGVQQRKVASLSLASRIPHIVYADAFGRACWKPHPRPYEAVEAATATAGNQLVYVADNPLKDFIGARQKGWHTVRVRRPDTEHGHRVPAPGYGADYELTNLTHLLELPLFA